MNDGLLARALLMERPVYASMRYCVRDYDFIVYLYQFTELFGV